MQIKTNLSKFHYVLKNFVNHFQSLFSCMHSGQGTVAVEILEQVPQVDAIVVPISGKQPPTEILKFVHPINLKIHDVFRKLYSAPQMLDNFT